MDIKDLSLGCYMKFCAGSKQNKTAISFYKNMFLSFKVYFISLLSLFGLYESKYQMCCLDLKLSVYRLRIYKKDRKNSK